MVVFYKRKTAYGFRVSLVASEIFIRGSNIVSAKRHRGLIATSDNPGDSAPTINFSVSFAQGGKIITTSFYDPKSDRHNRTVHVITDEDDFAERVKEIVFKECLTRG